MIAVVIKLVVLDGVRGIVMLGVRLVVEIVVALVSVLVVSIVGVVHAVVVVAHVAVLVVVLIVIVRVVRVTVPRGAVVRGDDIVGVAVIGLVVRSVVNLVSMRSPLVVAVGGTVTLVMRVGPVGVVMSRLVAVSMAVAVSITVAVAVAIAVVVAVAEVVLRAVGRVLGVVDGDDGEGMGKVGVVVINLNIMDDGDVSLVVGNARLIPSVLGGNVRRVVSVEVNLRMGVVRLHVVAHLPVLLGNVSDGVVSVVEVVGISVTVAMAVAVGITVTVSVGITVVAVTVAVAAVVVAVAVSVAEAIALVVAAKEAVRVVRVVPLSTVLTNSGVEVVVVGRATEVVLSRERHVLGVLVVRDVMVVADGVLVNLLSDCDSGNKSNNESLHDCVSSVEWVLMNATRIQQRFLLL